MLFKFAWTRLGSTLVPIGSPAVVCDPGGPVTAAINPIGEAWAGNWGWWTTNLPLDLGSGTRPLNSALKDGLGCKGSGTLLGSLFTCTTGGGGGGGGDGVGGGLET